MYTYDHWCISNDSQKYDIMWYMNLLYISGGKFSFHRFRRLKGQFEGGPKIWDNCVGNQLSQPYGSHSWQRVPNLPFLWRPPLPLYFLPPLFQILSNHHFLLPPTSTPLLFLLSCLFGWMDDRATFYVSLNEIMGLHMYVKPWYLAPKGPCCVFYATRCQVYWGLPCVVFCFYVKVADP